MLIDTILIIYRREHGREFEPASWRVFLSKTICPDCFSWLSCKCISIARQLTCDRPASYPGGSPVLSANCATEIGHKHRHESSERFNFNMDPRHAVDSCRFLESDRTCMSCLKFILWVLVSSFWLSLVERPFSFPTEISTKLNLLKDKR